MAQMWGANRIRRATPVLLLLCTATMTGGSAASVGSAVEPPETGVPVDAGATQPVGAHASDAAPEFDDAVVVETSVHLGPAPRLSGVDDLPDRALASYRHASLVLDAARPSCRIPWSLLAAVGGVASDHGERDGGRLTDAGLARPALVAAPQDGAEGAAPPDTDDGALDGSAGWDAPVGPLNLLPSAWRRLGVDGDGDGVRDPQDLDDAAVAVAAALCSSGDDLAGAADMKQAVIDFSGDPRYAAEVMELERKYRTMTFLAAPTQGVAVSAVPLRDTAAALPERTAPTKRLAHREKPDGEPSPAEPTPEPVPEPTPEPAVAAAAPAAEPTPLPTASPAPPASTVEQPPPVEPPTPAEPESTDPVCTCTDVVDPTTETRTVCGPPVEDGPVEEALTGDVATVPDAAETPETEPATLAGESLTPCPPPEDTPVDPGAPDSGQPTLVATEPETTAP